MAKEELLQQLLAAAPGEEYNNLLNEIWAPENILWLKELSPRIRCALDLKQLAPPNTVELAYNHLIESLRVTPLNVRVILDRFKTVINGSEGPFQRHIAKQLSFFIKHCINKEVYQKNINDIATSQLVKSLSDISAKFKKNIPRKIKLKLKELIKNLANSAAPEELLPILIEIEEILLSKESPNKNLKGFAIEFTTTKNIIHSWFNQQDDEQLPFIHANPRKGPHYDVFMDVLSHHYLQLIHDVFNNHYKDLKYKSTWQRFSYRTRRIINKSWSWLFADSSKFFIIPEKDEIGIAKEYRDEVRELIKSEKILHNNNEEKNHEHYQQIYKLIDKIGSQYKKSKKEQNGLGYNHPLTLKMGNLLRAIELGYPEKNRVEKTIKSVTYECLRLQIEQYRGRRHKPAFYHDYHVDLKGLKYKLSDLFNKGGHKDKKNGKLYDGQTARLNSCTNLRIYCITAEEEDNYLIYLAAIVKELTTIKRKKSLLREILFAQIKQILHEKILPKNDAITLATSYLLLQRTLKDNKYFATSLDTLTKHIENHTTIKLTSLKEKATPLREKKIIRKLLTKKQQQVADQHPETMNFINNDAALKEFYTYSQAKLNNELLAYKIASTGLFKTKEKNLGTVAAYVPLAAGLAAGAIGAAAANYAGGIISSLGDYADQENRRNQFGSIKEFLSSANMCDHLSHHVMKDYTKIWEHHIREMHQYGVENVKLFADCIVARVMDYLSQQCYQGVNLPIEKQLCFAAMSQDIRHSVIGTRLMHKDIKNEYSKGAWIVEEMLTRTGIKIDTKVHGPMKMDPKYGYVYYGKEGGKEAQEILGYKITRMSVSEVLQKCQVGSLLNNDKLIASSPFKNTPFKQYGEQLIKNSDKLIRTNIGLKQEVSELKEQLEDQQQRIENQDAQIKELYRLLGKPIPKIPAQKPITPAIRRIQGYPNTGSFWYQEKYEPFQPHCGEHNADPLNFPAPKKIPVI